MPLGIINKSQFKNYQNDWGDESIGRRLWNTPPTKMTEMSRFRTKSQYKTNSCPENERDGEHLQQVTATGAYKRSNCHTGIKICCLLGIINKSQFKNYQNDWGMSPLDADCGTHRLRK